MFSAIPLNCSDALLRFSSALWSAATFVPAQPCVTWRDVVEHTFNMPRPGPYAQFNETVAQLSNDPKFAAVNMTSTLLTDEVWLPRGTDVFLVFVSYCALVLLSVAFLKDLK